MNLALLVTKKNISEMETTARKMGEMQTSRVNGAFCVFYDSTIPKEKIISLTSGIGSSFPALSYAPIQINGSMSNDLQVAVLFGSLIIQAYSRFPGPWMIVDSLSIPLVSDFMQAAEKQHKGLGGGMSGRAVEGKGSILPVGPVVIELPHRAIKFLRYPVSVSWRERGRFQFARCRFSNIPSEDYIWSLSETKCEPKEETAEDESGDEPNFDEMGKEDLIAYIGQMTGKYPFRTTGMPRLISEAKEAHELSKQPA
jgi:hypothetical protein